MRYSVISVCGSSPPQYLRHTHVSRSYRAVGHTGVSQSYPRIFSLHMGFIHLKIFIIQGSYPHDKKQQQRGIPTGPSRNVFSARVQREKQGMSHALQSSMREARENLSMHSNMTIQYIRKREDRKLAAGARLVNNSTQPPCNFQLIIMCSTRRGCRDNPTCSTGEKKQLSCREQF